MSIITSQQLKNYYSDYKDIEVNFNTQVISATGLLAKQIYFKCVGNHWPCVIYSSSMSSAKIIANLNVSFYDAVKHADNLIQLRFAFKRPDKSDPLTFFIAAKIAGFTPYGKKKGDLNFISLNYTQKPPNDLIEILGILLEAKESSKNRQTERIVITPESSRVLGLKSKDAIVSIDKIPRRCLIRDIAFGGAKIILIGIAKFLIDKSIVLHVAFEDETETMALPGKIIRNEEVAGRKDLTALAIQFDDESLPLTFKMKISQYFKQMHKKYDHS
ncbi:MAG: PilZ domain-containing protein [Spirochaetia bacterium]